MTTFHEQQHIPAFRYANSLGGARLRALAHEAHGPRKDLVLDYDELRHTRPSVLTETEGVVHEQIWGEYTPRRLRFMGVSDLVCAGIYTHLEDYPLDHAARSVLGTLYWPPQATRLCIFSAAREPAQLRFSVWRYRLEERSGQDEAVELIRDWAPLPPIPARLVTVKKRVHEIYGGDPVTVHLAGQAQARRLFVGGVVNQGQQRPAVDAVLSLSEEESRWVAGQPPDARDRHARKGEGSGGMPAAEIKAEADWVCERLRAGQRVLVHCSAGVNRSVTVCCGVLIRLEGLSAEAALARVREHHPWAQPDMHHWLGLRWLAEAK